MIEFTLNELSLGSIESGLCDKLQLGEPQSSSINIDEIQPGVTFKNVMISGTNGSIIISKIQISNNINNVYNVKVIK